MSNLRAGPYTLKDPNDDAAFQELKNDVTEILIRLLRGTQASPGLTTAQIQALINTAIAAIPAVAAAFVPTVILSLTSGTGQVVPLGGAITNLNFWDTVVVDTYSIYNGTTGAITIPSTGLYLLTFSIPGTPNASAAASAFVLIAAISGSVSANEITDRFYNNTGLFIGHTSNCSMANALVAGDVIQLKAGSGVAWLTGFDGTYTSFLTLTKFS